MRAWLSRALFVSAAAFFLALIVASCSGCNVRADERSGRPKWVIRPLSPSGSLLAPQSFGAMKEGEIIFVPSDPCDWQDTPWWVRIVLGCPDGGSSGAQ